MAYTPRFGTKQRDELYSRECTDACKNGRGRYPICVHCDLPVTPGQAWDEAHIGTPRALGGQSTGVGHRRCNQLDNNRVVTPTLAKVKRVRRRHVGIAGLGLGRHPLPAGVRSAVSLSMTRRVRPRLTHAEKHAAFLARRYFAGIPGA